MLFKNNSLALSEEERTEDIQKGIPDEYFEFKTRIHNKLLDNLDLSLLDTMDKETLGIQIRRMVERILEQEDAGIPLNMAEREKLVQEIVDEVLGLGPLEPFLQDPTISDIMISGYRKIFIERRGKIERTNARFKDDNHLRKIIDKIVSNVGRHIDESSPMVDARLDDGSRVNAVIPPLAIDGPVLCIRKFAADPLELEDLIEFNSLIPEIGELIKGMVKARLNIVISGGTGSGKTTMLNVMSRFIPEDEHIITIEDSAELQLKQYHVDRLETRPANIEGKGEITQRHLVKNTLRMRPDRIILGEIRGEEALDMLQAMNTGHDGSLTTIHANSPRDALMRLETMVAMANMDIPTVFMRRYVSSALNAVLQIKRLADGTRKLISLQEVVGMEGDMITMQEIFNFKQATIDNEGKVKGRFKFTGIRPKFMERLCSTGIDISQELFDPNSIFKV